MHNIRKITDNLTWVGANDRRLAMFEGVYSVPKGVSYNSYLLQDREIVLFDAVDKAVHNRFIENLNFVLDGKTIDYLVVQHMEPDHSDGICDLLNRYPKMKVVCNAKSLVLIKQFYNADVNSRVKIVSEGDVLNTGKHNLHFIMAPMVHWPEVMVTYDSTSKVLFSADAFGSFGALNGALFADEVDFSRDYMDETRRYFTNIVGKYGPQVKSLLNKASNYEIDMICPLHGFVWRKNLESIVSKHRLWSNYEPEVNGVMIAYASIYGNTENAAEILATNLWERGIKTVMFDVSVTPASEIVAAAFQYSHHVYASTTYNANIFVTMEALISDIVGHNIQNRTVAIIENGSWAATSGGLIRDNFEKCKNIKFIGDILTVKSSLKEEQIPEVEKMADALANDINTNIGLKARQSVSTKSNDIDPSTMFKLSYGLFVLSAKHGGKDNGCIINTVTQLTSIPTQVSIALNKSNFTHDMIVESKEFNVSVLTEQVPFSVFEKFGFASGRDTDKFIGYDESKRTKNGIYYFADCANSVISAKVIDIIDAGTHSVFISEVSEAFVLSEVPSVTYQYYFDNIKPKQEQLIEKKGGYVCKICGYVYEGEPLPENFICPICKHGASDFKKA